MSRLRRRVSIGAAGVLAITGVAAGLAATAAATGSGQSGGRPAASRFDSALIAVTAQRYVGRWGGQACLDSHHDLSGQCRQFVNCVVALASGNRVWPVDPHGDYQKAFAENGGTEVTAATAAAGDVIQVGDRDTDPDLHTAIVLNRHRDGTLTVIDANWVGAPTTPELVGVHDYTPPAQARFWRLGTVTATSGSARSAAAAGAVQNGTDPGPATVPPAPILAAAQGSGAEFGTVTASNGPHNPTPVMIRFWLDGHPQATIHATSGRASLHVDTTALTDGPHELAAQSITASGVISPISTPLTLDITDHAPAINATVPPAAVHAGNIPITVSTGPGLDITAATLTVTVDRHQTATTHTTIGPGHAVLTLDTRTLTPGPHQITVTAADRHGHTATALPLQVTTAPVAATQPVAVDAAAVGRSDLIALDTAGNLLRYPATDTGTLGTPQTLHPSPGGATLLTAGRLTPGATSAQLLIVGNDGTARLYDLASDGAVRPQGAVTGPRWKNYVRLMAGPFTATTGTAADQILAISTDGHLDTITIGPGGRATSHALPGLQLTPAETATAFTGPGPAGHDALFTTDDTGTATTHTTSTTGFDTAHTIGHLPTPAAGTAPVTGHFTNPQAPQILTDTTDGQVILTTAPTNPAMWTASTNGVRTPPRHAFPVRYL